MILSARRAGPTGRDFGVDMADEMLDLARRNQLATAGFVDVSVTFTHEVADGLHGAIVRATKPAT